MAGKGKEYFGLEDLGTRRRRNQNPAPMPVDITNNVHQISDYADIPCEKLCNYQKRDPHDIVDKSDPEYQALVTSISKNGVYDAIIVRPITDESIKDKGAYFEILSGHHRTEASRDAGKNSVPAKIIRDCSDSEAEDIYRITNLLRKKQSIRDLAYGWWHYFRVTRYQSAEKVDEMISNGIVSESFRDIKESQSNKQLHRYARLHELTDEMMELVEKKAMSIKFAVEISFIDKKRQNDLLDYKTNLKSLEKAKQLRALAEGNIAEEKWCKKSIEKILFPNPLSSERKTEYNDRTFITTLQQYIPKQYHDEENMLSLIQEALSLYFEQNPEKQN